MDLLCAVVLFKYKLVVFDFSLKTNCERNEKERERREADHVYCCGGEVEVEGGGFESLSLRSS
jgi:hypothetical protein